MTGLQESEWQQLHDRHAAELWRFTLSLTRDRQVAEDIVQEVLLRAWRADDLAHRDESATRAWLFTVARRLVIDRWRSAPVRREVPDASEERIEVSAPAGDRQDRTDELLDRWLIADALTDLTEDHRAVLIAAYYEGRTTADIAGRLEIAEGTVKSRLHYGLRHLRMILQEKGVTRS
ncbi:sigma-70 family RNA polymerase sigma factor [Microlunatus soli]|uniref:RNA polymerase sigma factor n=1 Tax=Microlunatus soli TaxID=630515 RepID=A0A1H1Y7L0_9ACTN|nr:sigma-70 family RNA polymerase sigma factor [Microlunatus soli]SDT17371.1 RNA polymerase, sigma-24 subunit, RpoE [Microlunatus soli]